MNHYSLFRLSLLADVAERLRRLTRNQFPSGSVGSIPTVCGCTTFAFNTRIYYHYPGIISIRNWQPVTGKTGPIRELNPGPLTPKARIMLLDQ